MNRNEQQKYRKLYRDILRGYSGFNFSDKEIYIKHLTECDLGDVEADEEEMYAEAEGRGVLTEKEKLKLLERDKLWSTTEEARIQALKQEITNLDASCKKLILKNQIKFAQKNIAKRQEVVDELERERGDLLGFTVETYVEKKITSIYLKYSLYSDQDLKEKFFTEELFDEISDDEMSALAMENNIVMHALTSGELKKLAVCSFFINGISLCSKNTQIFYGKPITELTNYQIDLFSRGLRYLSVLEEGKTPPSDLYADHKLLAEWYDAMLEAKRMGLNEKGPRSRRENEGGTVMGATKEELENFMGQSRDGEEVVDLAKEIKKRGGRQLSMKDVIEIHGGGKKKDMLF